MEFRRPSATKQSKPAEPVVVAPITEPTTFDVEVASTAKPRRIDKRLTVAGALVLVVSASYGIFTTIQHNAASKQATQAAAERVENLEYQTVLPAGKTISELGGWQRISPPDGAPVFAYGDSIENIPINVSQQPLPDAMRANPIAQIADLAEKFNATNKVSAGDTTIYIGTSAKGPQSVVLTKNNLLILMKSEQKIADGDWATYAASLK